MTLDAVDTDAIQIGERGAELIHLGERQRGIVEFSGRAIDLVLMVVQLFLDVQRPEPIDVNAVEEFAPNEERRDAEAAEQPFVCAAGHRVDARLTHIDRKHADGLNGIGIEQGTVRVRQLGERTQIVPEPVLVRHPRD